MKTNSDGKITIEMVNKYREENNLSVYETIDEILNNNLEYPIKPKKPYLNNSHTALEASEYAHNLANHEDSIIDYNNKKSEYDKVLGERIVIVEEFIKLESGFYIVVPEKYQSKLYSFAYSEGHSSGYYDIYNKLSELVEIFK